MITRIILSSIACSVQNDATSATVEPADTSDNLPGLPATTSATEGVDSIAANGPQEILAVIAVPAIEEWPPPSSAPATATPKAEPWATTSVYGSLRPAITHSRGPTPSRTVFTDFLSRIGFLGTAKLGDNVDIEATAEWAVNFASAGDFTRPRQVYIAIDAGKAGRIGIGTQWSPYFNGVAMPGDVFNHRSSPFAYDHFGPFQESNQVTYRVGNKFVIYEGSARIGALDPESHIDGATSSLKFFYNGLTLGAGGWWKGYVEPESELDSASQRLMFGGVAAYDFARQSHISAMYQHLPAIGRSFNFAQPVHTLDTSFVTQIYGPLRIKTGYSLVLDPQRLEREVKHIPNATLHYDLSPLSGATSFLFLEYLGAIFPGQPIEHAVSSGIRLDFNMTKEFGGSND